MGREREVRKTTENSLVTAAKNILFVECSSTTSNAALRAELGMCQLETNRDVRKLKWK